MRKTILSAIVLAACSILAAQQALTNDGVVKLVKAGLSDDLIVNTINAQPSSFDASPEGIIALKTAGASDKVVNAVVAKAAASLAAPAAPAAPSSPAAPTAPATPYAPAAPMAATSMSPDDTAGAHDLGIYLYSDISAPGTKLTRLTGSTYARANSGSKLTTDLTAGLTKRKVRATLTGTHADVRTNDPHPVFYIYFDETATAANADATTFPANTNPNNFTIVKFDAKDGRREAVIGEHAAMHNSVGTEHNETSEFTFTKIRPGLYRVELIQPLVSGEFAFVPVSYLATATDNDLKVPDSGKLFDFGRN
jgi:hypothetical protein